MLKTSIEDLKSLFKDLGVKPGDNVMVHSSVFSLGVIENGIAGFHSAMTQTIGDEGNIIVPTFTHSYRNNNVFSILNTPADRSLGIYSEFIRLQPKSVRNTDPLFSMALLGKEASLIERKSINCFGGSSVYERLFESDILFLALGITYSTGLSAFMHLEKLAEVPYRESKLFYGESIDEMNVRHQDSAIHFVRNEETFFANGRTNREPIGLMMEDAGVSKAIQFRNGKHFALRAKSFKEFVLEKLNQNKMLMFENN